VNAVDTIGYNPLLLEEDPYPTYRRLRDDAPLYRGDTGAGAFWALSRFDDVDAAVRDWQTFSSAHGNDLDDTGLLFGPAPAMDLADPPVHTRHRQALRHVFSPQIVSTKLEPLARRTVRKLISRLRQDAIVDFAHDLAYPLPASLICEWLGFPEADRERIGCWHSATLDRVPGQIQLPAQAVRARDELWEYIRDALAWRRAHPQDDVLTELLRAHVAGELSEHETMANAFFFFDAGIVSTAALIGSSLLHLHRFAGQRELLRRSPDLIPAGVEELLRFDAPFQWFTRVTTRDVDLHGGCIPAGSRVVLIWASANRDERVWDEPDRLVVTRKPHRHLTFSGGVHQCLGAPIARMEVRVLLEELLPLLAGYEILGPVQRRITPSERTLVHLRARVTWSAG
jgi:cytochrome P450